jgi:hypothetical protein
MRAAGVWLKGLQACVFGLVCPSPLRTERFPLSILLRLGYLSPVAATHHLESNNYEKTTIPD